jgi:hypothetical protein
MGALVAPASYIAVILLSLEACVLLLIPLAITTGLWYGVRWLRRKLPPVFAQARKYLALAHQYAERGSAAAAAPFIAAHAFSAQARAWRVTLAGFFQGED